MCYMFDLLTHVFKPKLAILPVGLARSQCLLVGLARSQCLLVGLARSGDG